MVLIREASDMSCSSTMTARPQAASKEETRQRKRVTFERTCVLRLIPCLDDYTEDEIFNLWLDSISTEVIRKRYRADIEKMKQGVPEDESTCYRGLEWKFPGHLKAKQLARRRASVAVFLEQERQWENDVSQPEKISAIYAQMSSKSREEAFRRALEDSRRAFCTTEPRERRREQRSRLSTQIFRTSRIRSSVLDELK